MTTKTCSNCAHCIDPNTTYSYCVRVGEYCSVQLISGGRCAGRKTGTPEMNLWEQRAPLWKRIFGIKDMP